ncbi:unnamed protein product [Didymodactylos carnosus]|uniref:Uncharacterized protein n=1 Tax=Didymodactylos carnosus TaxID=1234261 RepID=A0A813TVB2_9BILA|nr:unnamed protein product [Didymodactylos carnosus]CAF3605134.1 unnamed protein product [Didymodactylos carnosus]
MNVYHRVISEEQIAQFEDENDELSRQNDFFMTEEGESVLLGDDDKSNDQTNNNKNYDDDDIENDAKNILNDMVDLIENEKLHMKPRIEVFEGRFIVANGNDEGAELFLPEEDFEKKAI